MDTGMMLPAACRQAQLMARPAAPSGGRGRASHPTHPAPGSAGDFHLCLCAPGLQALGFLLGAATPKPSPPPPGVALWWVSAIVPPQLHAPCHVSVIPGQLPPAHPMPPHHGATDCPHLRACHAPAATPALLCWWPCPAPCQCPVASAASPAHGISKGPRGTGGVQGWQHRCPPPGCPPWPWAGTHASLLASDAAFCSLPNRGFNLPSRLAKSYPKQFPSRSSKSQ